MGEQILKPQEISNRALTLSSGDAVGGSKGTAELLTRSLAKVEDGVVAGVSSVRNVSGDAHTERSSSLGFVKNSDKTPPDSKWLNMESFGDLLPLGNILAMQQTEGLRHKAEVAATVIKNTLLTADVQGLATQIGKMLGMSGTTTEGEHLKNVDGVVLKDVNLEHVAKFVQQKAKGDEGIG